MFETPFQYIRDFFPGSDRKGWSFSTKNLSRLHFLKILLLMILLHFLQQHWNCSTSRISR